jgi:hypothetical protein
MRVTWRAGGCVARKWSSATSPSVSPPSVVIFGLHISNIFAKLHVADPAEAIVRAREAGLGVRRGQ